VSQLGRRGPLLRVTVYALGFVAIVAMLVYSMHRRKSPASAENNSVEAVDSTAEGPPQPVAAPHISEARILAGCHPHLSPEHTSVPDIDVSERPNPAGVIVKARFWVNGDGFVTQAFLAGAYVYTQEEREDALHYIKGLTFMVPNTAECRVRQMELIGSFFEARGSSGDWATVFAVHPRYTLDGTHVVRNP
jgi:hypothetical protein